MTNTEIKKEEFFRELLVKTLSRTDLFADSTYDAAGTWVSSRRLISGVPVHINMRVTNTYSQVELYLHDSDPSANKRRHRYLSDKKEDIERKFGEPLEWGSYEAGSKQRKVYSRKNDGGRSDEKLWPAIQDDMIDRSIRLYEAVQGYFEGLKR
jgi:hypothetical protein